MALTRNDLKALGIDADKADVIIEKHVESTDGLKKENAELQAKIVELQKSQKDYEKIKEEFDTFRKDVTEKETLAKKKEILSKIAKDAGLSESGIQKALKYNLSQIELDEEGNAKNPNEVRKFLKEEWGEQHGLQIKTEGAKTPTPPTNTNTSNVMSKKEIMKIRDTTERQKALGEYLKAQYTN